jgi:hypothetical protein
VIQINPWPQPLATKGLQPNGVRVILGCLRPKQGHTEHILDECAQRGVAIQRSALGLFQDVVAN